MRKIVIFCASALLLAGSHAEAQQSRGYVMGLGGITFGTETAGAFGGEAGGWVGRNLVVFGEAGHMVNVAPKELQDDLDEAEDALEFLTGADWGFESKVPSTYFGGGAKYLFPSQRAMNFYVAGSAGFARLKAEITEQDFGDIIDDLIDEGFIEEDDVEGTEFYFSVGGGLMGNIGGSALYDVGYRFIKISDVNISRVMGGVGFRF
jgi:opacity protein-like surface antigen